MFSFKIDQIFAHTGQYASNIILTHKVAIYPAGLNSNFAMYSDLSQEITKSTITGKQGNKSLILI